MKERWRTWGNSRGETSQILCDVGWGGERGCSTGGTTSSGLNRRLAHMPGGPQAQVRLHPEKGSPGPWERCGGKRLQLTDVRTGRTALSKKRKSGRRGEVASGAEKRVKRVKKNQLPDIE